MKLALLLLLPGALAQPFSIDDQLGGIIAVSPSSKTAELTGAVGQGVYGKFFDSDAGGSLFTFADLDSGAVTVSFEFCSALERVNFGDINFDEGAIKLPLDRYVTETEWTPADTTATGLTPPGAAIIMGTFFTPPDSFLSQAFGYIKIEETGTYNMCLTHDDNARMRIGDALLIDADFFTVPSVRCRFTTFTETGFYPLQIQVLEQGGRTAMQMLWDQPGGGTDLSIVPQAVLFEPSACMADVFNDDFVPGSGGDPHFKTWAGEKFSFQGACDMVLLHSMQYSNGLGLDLHIRTKHRRDWSYIASAALRIGDEVFEVSAKNHYINGLENVELPSMFAGHVVEHNIKSDTQQTYIVHLKDKQRVVFKTWKDFVSVSVEHGKEQDFGDAVGLMGTFGMGLKLGRDGHSVFKDHDEFGQEWMVLPTDPKIFQELGATLTTCPLPTAVERRRLGEARITEDMAAAACAHVDTTDFDFCVFDVLATNDIEAAGAY